ncbi:MAG: YitT family protein [Oscillospiraceae bacterium]|nr:YitT family protein [Oscillospiraceae bacterium]
MTLGTALVSVGVYFFKFPNHFSMGGVSGLSVLLGEVVKVSFLTPSTFNSIINTAFLIAGFFVLSKGFGLRTAYCSLLYTGLVQLFEQLWPLNGPMTGETMLELFFAVLLPALGAAILFNIDASTGGTDIAAMILKKFTGLDVGRALLCCDVLIAASAFWVFGVKAGLCSVLGLVLKSVLVDSAIESLNRRKAFTVITEQPQPLCDYIMQEMGRSATIWEAKGAYSGAVHWVVLTALSRHQAVQLRNHLRVTDPKAFMMVENTSEIFGKGFFRA